MIENSIVFDNTPKNNPRTSYPKPTMKSKLNRILEEKKEISRRNAFLPSCTDLK